MNTAELVDDVALRMGDLLALELQIARRADELARARPGTRNENTDWECWLEAEREVLGTPELATAPGC